MFLYGNSFTKINRWTLALFALTSTAAASGTITFIIYDKRHLDRIQKLEKNKIPETLETIKPGEKIYIYARSSATNSSATNLMDQKYICMFAQKISPCHIQQLKIKDKKQHANIQDLKNNSLYTEDIPRSELEARGNIFKIEINSNNWNWQDHHNREIKIFSFSAWSSKFGSLSALFATNQNHQIIGQKQAEYFLVKYEGEETSTSKRYEFECLWDSPQHENEFQTCQVHYFTYSNAKNNDDYKNLKYVFPHAIFTKQYSNYDPNIPRTTDLYDTYKYEATDVTIKKNFYYLVFFPNHISDEDDKNKHYSIDLKIKTKNGQFLDMYNAIPTFKEAKNKNLIILDSSDLVNYL